MIDDKEIIDGLQKFIDKILNSESSEWFLVTTQFSLNNDAIASDIHDCTIRLLSPDSKPFIVRGDTGLRSEDIERFSPANTQFDLRTKFYDIFRDLDREKSKAALIDFLRLDTNTNEQPDEPKAIPTFGNIQIITESDTNCVIHWTDDSHPDFTVSGLFLTQVNKDPIAIRENLEMANVDEDTIPKIIEACW